MTSILSFQLILIILAVCYIDAQLTIFESGLNAGDGSYECGESLVLTCQIGAYSNSMTWQNDSSPTPIAECLQTNCYSDKTTVGLFEFSYDTNSGVFNLTIVQLTLDNNGTIYTCADGSKSSSIAITVEDYQPVVDESTQGKIVVSSGCIDRNTVVRFQFIKIKVDTGEEDGDIQINDVINIVACSEDISCGPNYFVQKTKSINIEPGSDYRLKMILTYDNNHRVESNPTNRKYKIGEPGRTKPSTTTLQQKHKTYTRLSTADSDTKPASLTNVTISSIDKPTHGSQPMPLWITAGIVVFIAFVTLTGYIICLIKKRKVEN